jgi:hypothetical protein
MQRGKCFEEFKNFKNLSFETQEFEEKMSKIVILFE